MNKENSSPGALRLSHLRENSVFKYFFLLFLSRFFCSVIFVLLLLFAIHHTQLFFFFFVLSIKLFNSLSSFTRSSSKEVRRFLLDWWKKREKRTFNQPVNSTNEIVDDPQVQRRSNSTIHIDQNNEIILLITDTSVLIENDVIMIITMPIC